MLWANARVDARAYIGREQNPGYLRN